MLNSQLPAGRLSGTNISRREGSLRAMFSAGTLVFALVSILVKQIPQSVCSPAILMYEPLISAVLPLVSEPLVLLFVVSTKVNTAIGLDCSPSISTLVLAMLFLSSVPQVIFTQMLCFSLSQVLSMLFLKLLFFLLAPLNHFIKTKELYSLTNISYPAVSSLMAYSRRSGSH